MSIALPRLRTIALLVASLLLVFLGIHCRAVVAGPCSQCTIVTEGYYDYGVTIRVNFFGGSLQQRHFQHTPPENITTVLYQGNPSLGPLESVEIVFDAADSNCTGGTIVMPDPPARPSIRNVNCDGWCWKFWIEYDVMGCPVVHAMKTPGRCNDNVK